MVHYLIEYVFLGLFGLGLSVMTRLIYIKAWKGEGRLRLPKIVFWGFCVVFVVPALYLAGFLICNDIYAYEQGLDSASVRFGYINKSGKVIIPFRFTWAGPFENGYALVKKDGISYWIDSLGNKAKDQNLHYLKEPVKRDVYERIGGECSTDEYDKIMEGEITIEDSASEGLYTVRLVKSKMISNKGYHYIRVRWGFKDTAGKLMIPPAFLAAYSFHDGLAVVDDTTDSPKSTTGLRMGYIDHTGHYVIRPIYEYAEDFNEGKAAVSKIMRD